nr:MLO protein homolog 1-like [Ipomoea batatas]
MGSHMKTAIFEEQTAKAVKKWQKEAKQRQKKRSSPTSPGFLTSPQNTCSSRDSSPSYLLHNLNNSSSAHPPISSSTNGSLPSDHSYRPKSSPSRDTWLPVSPSSEESDSLSHSDWSFEAIVSTSSSSG